MAMAADVDHQEDCEMNGRTWTAADTAILKDWAGRESDAEIGKRTGHAAITVRGYRNALGLAAYTPRTRAWTRRERLLHSAAGLDFQISNCPR
jgi:hypothetical protein